MASTRDLIKFYTALSMLLMLLMSLGDILLMVDMKSTTSGLELALFFLEDITTVMYTLFPQWY